MQPRKLHVWPRTGLRIAPLLLLLAPLAPAQGPLIDEDFEGLVTNGIPPDWVRLLYGTTNWYVSSGGINACSLPAHTGDSLLCNDEWVLAPTCSLTHDSSIYTPMLPYVPGQSLLIELDFTLDIDLSVGDRASVRLSVPSPVAPAPVTVESSDFDLFLTGPTWVTDHQFLVPSSALQAFEAFGGYRIEFLLQVGAPTPHWRGWGIDNVRVEPLAAVPLCFGDDPRTQACPCGNQSGHGEGCANATGSGGLLEACGSLSISQGDLKLSASQLVPGSIALFFQGDGASAPPSALGNGLLCLSAPLLRLEIVPTDALGHCRTSVDLPATGGVSAGQTVLYQLQYREDPALAPCSQASNLTNALEVTWGP